MGSLPSLKGRAVARALERAGFERVRMRGSHLKMVHSGPPRRTLSVPIHGGHDVKPGTLQAIVRQAGLTIDEFLALL